MSRERTLLDFYKIRALLHMSDNQPDVVVDEAQATFDREKAECDRFIAEFGGQYNSQGTRHRVMLYYEDMRRIEEYCRYLRDEAIGERTKVDGP
jgi:hypothetical protein